MEQASSCGRWEITVLPKADKHKTGFEAALHCIEWVNSEKQPPNPSAYKATLSKYSCQTIKTLETAPEEELGSFKNLFRRETSPRFILLLFSSLLSLSLNTNGMIYARIHWTLEYKITKPTPIPDVSLSRPASDIRLRTTTKKRRGTAGTPSDRNILDTNRFILKGKGNPVVHGIWD